MELIICAPGPSDKTSLGGITGGTVGEDGRSPNGGLANYLAAALMYAPKPKSKGAKKT